MSINLLDLVKDQMSSGVINHLSGLVGESTEKTGSALDSIFPTLLGGLVKKSEGSGGASAIFNALKDHDGGMLDDIVGAFSGGKKDSMLSMGSGIMDMIFGNKVSGIMDLVTKATGLGGKSSGGLMKMAAPLLMGVVGRYVKNKALDAVGLGKLLGSQKQHLGGAPSGLGNLLGLGGLVSKVADGVGGGARKVTGAAGDVARGTANVAGEAAGAGKSFLSRFWPLLLLAFLLFGGGGAWLCNTMNKAKDMVGDAAGAVADVAGDAAGAVGDVASGAAGAVGDAAGAVAGAVGDVAGGAWDAIKGAGLAVGEKLKDAKDAMDLGFEKGTAEARLANIIADGKANLGVPVILDQVTFATGSSTLTSTSNRQLYAVAKALKENPSVNLELRGHTDNTGDAAANETLSQARAAAVKAMLVNSGISADRLTAKGYGISVPIADNGTEEGRQANRRTDVLVTKR